MERRRFLKAMGFSSLIPFLRVQRQQESRRIDLLGVHIAGFQYHEGMRPEVLSALREGEELLLRREPDNPYDPSAIAILTRHGRKLGYLPRACNGIPAAIADQGVGVRAEIVEIDRDAPTWERVLVGVWQEV